MTLEPNQMLSHYRLAGKIGEGGMGVVWRALDTTLDREVAIKVLPDSFAKDADRISRFEREAKTLASLNHPNIGMIFGLRHKSFFLGLDVEVGKDTNYYKDNYTNSYD